MSTNSWEKRFHKDVKKKQTQNPEVAVTGVSLVLLHVNTLFNLVY